MRSIWWLLFGIVVLVFMSVQCAHKVELGVCQSDDQCPAGHICRKKRCLSIDCKTSKDCKDGKICRANACIPCTADTDCSSSKPCYTGPSATKGVGICREGLFGCLKGKCACKGQKLPTTEVCDGKDNNCDGKNDEGLSCYCPVRFFAHTKTFKEHGSGVSTLAISRDGKMVISRDRYEVSIWERATGKQLGRIVTSEVMEECQITFAPRGQYVAFPLQDGITIWDLHSKQSVGNLLRYSDRMKRAVWSPSGTWLASSGSRGRVYIWNMNTRKLYYEVFTNEQIRDMAFTSDSKYLVAGAGPLVFVWDLSKKKQLHKISGFEFVDAVRFSPDNSQFVAATYANLRAWDTRTGKLIYTKRLKTSAPGIPKERLKMYGLAYRPDGKVLVSGGSDGKLKFWSADKGHLIRSFENAAKDITAIVFAPDGKSMLVSDRSGNIKTWSCSLEHASCQKIDCTETTECKQTQVCSNCKCKACTEDEQCGADQICLQGSCKAGNCHTQKDCRRGQSCKNNICQDCKQRSDCAPDMICEKGKCFPAQCTDKKPCPQMGKACVEGRCTTCSKDEHCKKDGICEQQVCCEKLAGLSGSLERCAQPHNPCSRKIRAPVCSIDSDCTGDTVCWWGFCVNRQQWESGTGFDCMESRVVLGYRGAAPDRIYTFLLTLPRLQTKEGKAITDSNSFYLSNPIRPFCFRDRCYQYHKKVTFKYDTKGLQLSGANSFVLYRLRQASSLQSVGPGWLGSQPLPVTWKVRWQFGSDSPERFASVLSIKIWHKEGNCRSEISYQGTLPATATSIKLTPKVRKLCKWPKP